MQSNSPSHDEHCERESAQLSEGQRTVWWVFNHRGWLVVLNVIILASKIGDTFKNIYV